ncbi:MAG: hypothetical protein NC177_00435 [Ruminococcus flavefaciens]|nr:hypothetical protein [Ruminococcus flavefaciens]
MKKLIALLMACATMTCAFVSCGNDESSESSVSESSTSETTEETTESATEEETAEPTTEQNEVSAFVGKWQGLKFVADGEESTDFMGEPIYAMFQLELCEDGIVNFGEFMSQHITHSDVTWSWKATSDTQCEFFSDDGSDSTTLTIDGDYLVITEDDEKVYLERVDEFTEYQPEETEGEGEWITEDTEFTTHEVIEDADKTAFVGKWQGEKIEFEGETATDVMDISVSVLYQYDLKEDGTLALGDSLMEISGDTTEYTWGVISDTEIEIVNVEMQVAVVMELEGDYLVSNADGQKAYLAKVDEFEAFDLESFMNGYSIDDTDTTEAEDDTVSGTESTDTINE